MGHAERQFDKTHLSIDIAEARGFIHRDYLAHCLRWSHVAKAAAKHPKEQRWLDIGCGKDQPLARLLYTNKMAPTEGYYLGVDLNKLEPHSAFKNSSWQPMLLGGVDVLEALKVEKNELVLNHESTNIDVNNLTTLLCSPLPTKVVSFEVLEHVNPAYCRKVIKFIEIVLREAKAEAYISTPCYDADTGAAANHINEMTYTALGALFEDLGLGIAGVWGTFASQRDYLPHLNQAELEVFDRLKQYYDSNLLAIMLAPLHPEHARNCLWQLVAAPDGYVRRFPALKDVPGPWSSSPQWEDLGRD